MFEQNGQRATRHRSKTDEQDSIRKFNHPYSSPCGNGAKQANSRKNHATARLKPDRSASAIKLSQYLVTGWSFCTNILTVGSGCASRAAIESQSRVSGIDPEKRFFSVTGQFLPGFASPGSADSTTSDPGALRFTLRHGSTRGELLRPHDLLQTAAKEATCRKQSHTLACPVIYTRWT
jgi:hypothetical protein